MCAGVVLKHTHTHTHNYILKNVGNQTILGNIDFYCTDKRNAETFLI